MRHLARPPRLPWATLVLPAMLLAPSAASARPVGASDIQIWYRFTDSEGMSTTQELRPSDLNYFVNQARCQCGQQIAANVNLLRSMDEPYDDLPVRTFVGSQCGQGQESISEMYRPCVKYFEGQPNEYDDGGIDIVFDMVWLSSRVPNIGDTPETAQPIDPCLGTQSGEAGIWICVEDGMQTDCQSSEFIISGTQNQNGGTSGGTPTDPTQGGMQSSGGIVFDYLPPQADVTGFSSSPGDGAVVIRWDRTESTQINGFRVLCADLDGNPMPGKGASEPPFSLRTNGELYYTAENLCPGAVVYESDSSDVPLPLPTGGSDEGGESTGGGSSTGAGLDDVYGNGWAMGGTITSGVGSSSSDGSGTGSGGSTTDGGTTGGTTGGTAGSGSADTGGSGVALTDSPLSSLDWEYVCSDHITGTGTEARVDGLQNGKAYQFIVVAYDRAGNPLIVSGDEVMIETPEETTDFWEQCEMQGDLCGDGGFCHCRTGVDGRAAWLGSGLLLLIMAGLRRRGRP